MTKAPSPAEMSKGQSDNTNNATKSLITQRLRTDLGRSVGVTTATQLVWFTGFTSAQWPRPLWVFFNPTHFYLRSVTNQIINTVACGNPWVIHFEFLLLPWVGRVFTIFIKLSVVKKHELPTEERKAHLLAQSVLKVYPAPGLRRLVVELTN